MDATLRNSFCTGGADRQTGAPGRAMSRLAKVFVLFVVLVGLGVWSSEALAIAKFARVAGNWSAVGTWSSVSCAAAGATTVPSAADDVTICNGINVTVDGAGVAGSVTIAPGATATALTLGAAGTLTVTNASGLSGNVIINGSTASRTRSLAVGARTLTVTGNVTINGGATTGGVSNISQLTVTTTPGTANIGGNLIINAGTVNTSVARATVTTGTINVAGDVTLTGGVTSNTRDVLLSVTGASAVGAGVNIGGNLNINSTLATTSTVSMTSTGRITVTGNVTNGDMLTIGAGVFTANGATFATTNPLITTTTSVTSGTLSIAGNAAVAGGAANPSGATMSVTTGILTVGGNLDITAGSNTLAIATTSVTTGRITVNGNTTVTGGAAAGRNALLTASNIPAVAGNGINLNGMLTTVATAAGGVATATVSMTTAGAINVAGDVNNGGTVTIGTGTFSVTNAASTYANNSAAVVATTTISTGTLNVPGNLTNAAGDAITVTGAGNINVGGNWGNGGAFTAGTGTVTFNGTAQQTITGATTFNNMTVNNAAGIVLANDITATSAATGVVTLTSGIVTTGVNTLIVPRVCNTPSVARINGYVIGNLQLAFPTSVPARTCTYNIGDSIGYLPVTVVLTGATAGTLTGRVDSGDHPDTIANISGIDQTRSANRYWTLTPGTLATYTSYAATFQFCVAACTNAERDATATVGSFIVAKKNAGAWARPAVGVRTATTIQVTGVTSVQGFGDFAVGESLTGVYKGVNQLIDLREVY